MKLISIITTRPTQTLKVVIPETGKSIDLILKYKEQQQGWFLSFTYQSFVVNNVRVVTSGNFLHKFKNSIPFGLSCVTEANEEPTLLNDFSFGRSKMYLLDSTEVTSYSEVLSGQATA